MPIPQPTLGLLKGTLELVILRSLASGGEMHGFEIIEWVRERTEDELLVEDGALYHALHRMAARGWVEGLWAVSERGRRARYYRLTSVGVRMLKDEDLRWGRYVAALAKLAPAHGESGGAGA